MIELKSIEEVAAMPLEEAREYVRSVLMELTEDEVKSVFKSLGY